ncbi:MAG TPA: hypothetical protein VF720_14875, partial [Candidatus Eisenbacteria bacterium]
MKASRVLLPALLVLLGTSLAFPAGASFHLMQIEQVIGGVNGDVTAQAIQLRMRAAGQNLVGQSRIKVRDAAGANPITLIDMTTNVPNGVTGDRVLLVTAPFQTYVNAAVTPDFVFTTPIPASYLAAGSLTFEDDFGTIYWRVSWGGAGYTGTGSMSSLNDPNLNCNPAFAGALPSTTLQALKFQGASTAQSNTNGSDYALTPGASVWTNNARQNETLESQTGVGDPPRPGTARIELSRAFPNPTRGASHVTFVLESAGHAVVSVYDAVGRRVRVLLDGS